MDTIKTFFGGGQQGKKRLGWLHTSIAHSHDFSPFLEKEITEKSPFFVLSAHK
ncbi:hypothetical protein [Zongyangia hominis]|uniref:Uncharacterized protein n=1 Tax=Zongyangia hominis TaxID=2763677 RepID=A0A926I9X5_9FIRM|nr:hypothetical protein [Zongyangia hominis]MBC8569626.1 hypothetical protein [Zongyangia hominis]